MKEQLEECLKLRMAIGKINTELYKINAAAFSPKNQAITGMPRSQGSNGNDFDRYISKKQRLLSQKKQLQSEQNDLWREIEKKLKNNSIGNRDIYILYLRFFKGLLWKECTNAIKKKIPKWNDNATFRRYRKVLSKFEGKK